MLRKNLHVATPKPAPPSHLARAVVLHLHLSGQPPRSVPFGHSTVTTHARLVKKPGFRPLASLIGKPVVALGRGDSAAELSPT